MRAKSRGARADTVTQASSARSLRAVSYTHLDVYKRQTSASFSSFLSGQCLEAFILATMFFISMSLLGMPYALVVAVLIGVTALIPIFGAFIGCFVGVFLILIASPIKALWFLVLFLVLQQVEGNVIYPRRCV